MRCESSPEVDFVEGIVLRCEPVDQHQPVIPLAAVIDLHLLLAADGSAQRQGRESTRHLRSSGPMLMRFDCQCSATVVLGLATDPWTEDASEKEGDLTLSPQQARAAHTSEVHGR
jgi:hypothetical protein